MKSCIFLIQSHFGEIKELRNEPIFVQWLLKKKRKHPTDKHGPRSDPHAPQVPSRLLAISQRSPRRPRSDLWVPMHLTAHPGCHHCLPVRGARALLPPRPSFLAAPAPRRASTPPASPKIVTGPPPPPAASRNAPVGPSPPRASRARPSASVLAPALGPGAKPA